MCVCVSTGEPRARACAQVNRWGWECWSVTSAGTRCEVQPWRKLVHDTSLSVTAARRRVAFILRVFRNKNTKSPVACFLIRACAAPGILGSGWLPCVVGHARTRAHTHTLS